jgi:hypothetical protein
VPKTRHGLPTDTLGRYTDTTVSPPVSKAARHITVLCARRVVISQRSAREQREMMACCRSAEACAATVCTEAAAQQVSASPSPVRGY